MSIEINIHDNDDYNRLINCSCYAMQMFDQRCHMSASYQVLPELFYQGSVPRVSEHVEPVYRAQGFCATRDLSSFTTLASYGDLPAGSSFACRILLPVVTISQIEPYQIHGYLCVYIYCPTESTKKPVLGKSTKSYKRYSAIVYKWVDTSYTWVHEVIHQTPEGLLHHTRQQPVPAPA